MTTRLQWGIDCTREHDLLVIGGGITGVAIAYEAASRGLDVALVEKDDLGGATSAATGKLIHGGLRYLKNFEVGLVRESLAERRILSLIAPGLLDPIPIVLPSPGLVEHLGLSVYDLLSYDRNRVPDPALRMPGHRSMGQKELQDHGLAYLSSALLYYDTMMPSPERLTLAFARSAAARGAALMTRAEVQQLTVHQGRVLGATVHDKRGGQDLEVRAKLTINASGPWAHDLLTRSAATETAAGAAPPVRSEGIYLVTRALSDIMVLFYSKRGHFSFAPWRGHSLIGPTETAYEGDVSRWRLTRKSIRDFLAHINTTSQLPQPLTMDDVVAAYGGLRPLTEAADTNTYQASRASECRDHQKDGLQGLISAMGGKYTTSRAFAVKTMALVSRKLGQTLPPSQTAHTPLDGCDIGERTAAIAAARAAHPDFAANTIEHLVRYYGTDHDQVLSLARQRPELAEVLNDDGEILAQAAYAVHMEGATTLNDVLLRRTGLGTLGDPGHEHLSKISQVVARAAGWDGERTKRELLEAQQALRLPED